MVISNIKRFTTAPNIRSFIQQCYRSVHLGPNQLSNAPPAPASSVGQRKASIQPTGGRKQSTVKVPTK
jgi:hypothetical protein